MKNDRKDIAVVEIYSHYVFVHTLAASLLLSGHNVTVYVSRRIFKDLEPMFLKGETKPNFCVSSKDENDFSFLFRVRREIENNCDLLFINSIQGYRIVFFYLLRFKIPTIAGAGRISEFFGARYKLLGFNSIRQVLHHNFTKFLLPKVMRRLSGLIVHSIKAKELALDGGYKKPVFCMPFALNVRNSLDIEGAAKEINFLVTGSITERARDYFSLLGLFEKIWDSGVKNASLTVLTSPRTPYGFKVFEEMQRLEGKGYPIRFFSKWISEGEFVDHSSRADFIIAPIKKEYYGAGEITSVEVESVRMGIPAFYPDWYYVAPDRLDISVQYSSFSHLYKLVMDLVSDTTQVELIRVRARKIAENYSVEPVSKRLNEFIVQEILGNVINGTFIVNNVDE
jgi:hypothetical protein